MDGASQFDPYHKWLGIPPDERPVSHYRLLGLQLFEADVDVITNAADRQMAHVKSFAAGPRASDSQQLLNVLSQARVCLLKPAAKAEYDRQLRATIAATLEPSVATPQPLQTAAVDAHDTQNDLPVVSVRRTPRMAVTASLRRSRRHRRTKAQFMTGILSLLILMVMSSAVAYVMLVKFYPECDFLRIFAKPLPSIESDGGTDPQAVETDAATWIEPTETVGVRSLPAESRTGEKPDVTDPPPPTKQGVEQQLPAENPAQQTSSRHRRNSMGSSELPMAKVISNGQHENLYRRLARSRFGQTGAFARSHSRHGGDHSRGTYGGRYGGIPDATVVA